MLDTFHYKDTELCEKYSAAFGGERKLGLCKKPSAFRLAAQAAKFYFEWTLFYLILLRKMR